MNLYQENILDHYKRPRNFGRLDKPTASIEHTNPLCGDRLHLDLLVDDGKLIDIRFDGEGCAISLAAASMLTERLKGLPLRDLQEFSDQDMQDELGIELSPTRLKCGLLAVSAARRAVE